MRRNGKLVILSAVVLMAIYFVALFAQGDKNNTMQVNNTIGKDEVNTDNASIASDAKQKVNLTDASHFSEGIAWVKYVTQSGENIGLLKTNGEIVASTGLASLDGFGSDFSGGYAYVNRYSYDKDTSSFMVFDKTGSIIAKSPDDTSSYKILAGGDGVFLVQQELRSMTVNESRFGVIAADGKWIMELEKDMPLIKGLSEEGYIFDADANRRKQDKYQLKTYYLGERVFMMCVDSGYDTKVSLLDVNRPCCSHWTDSEYMEVVKYDECTPYKFFEGKGLYWTSGGYSDDVLSIYDKCGNITFTMAMNKDRKVYYNDGIFFMGYSEFENESVIRQGAFYDMDGNMLIDLSEYTFVASYTQNGFYEFYDGKAAVKILGADKAYYISHIDLEGNFLYEPIKIDHASNKIGHSGCYGDALYICDREFGNQILHTDGTLTPMPDKIKIWDQWSTKDESEFHFSEGLAWCKSNNVFIDETGEFLVTYVVS